MSREPVLGIDLGTTNSVVAVADGTESRVLSNELGHRLIPSVVSFKPGGGVVVGEEARERRLLDAKSTIYSVKRLIGRPYRSPEVRMAQERFAFRIEESSTGGVVVGIRKETYTLTEISAFVLREVARVAELDIGPCTQAVITVPANFNELQRSATKAAGRVAGLEVLRIINEPTAAALAYGYGREEPERVAIFDLGGGTFDITILDLENDVFEVISTAGDSFLGGDDVDLLISEMMCDAFLAQHRWDPRADRQAYERLRAAAEWAKCQLSLDTQVELTVEELHYGVGGKRLDLQFELERQTLERAIQPLLARAFDVCNDAFKQAGLKPTEIDNVVLVGGSTRMPLVQSMVREYFKNDAQNSIDPDLVVAQGAAIHGYAVGARSRPRKKSIARVALKKISARDRSKLEAERKARQNILPRQPAFAPARAPLTRLGTGRPPPPPPLQPSISRQTARGLTDPLRGRPSKTGTLPPPSILAPVQTVGSPRSAKGARPSIETADFSDLSNFSDSPTRVAVVLPPTLPKAPGGTLGETRVGPVPTGSVTRVAPAPQESVTRIVPALSDPAIRVTSLSDPSAEALTRVIPIPPVPDATSPVDLDDPAFNEEEVTTQSVAPPALPSVAKADTLTEIPEFVDTAVETPVQPKVVRPNPKRTLLGIDALPGVITAPVVAVGESRKRTRSSESVVAKHLKEFLRSDATGSFQTAGFEDDDITEEKPGLLAPPQVAHAPPPPPPLLRPALQPPPESFDPSFGELPALELDAASAVQFGGPPDALEADATSAVLKLTERRAPLLMDVTPHSLGVETAGGYCQLLIRRNSPIPAEQIRVFSTASDNQVQVSIRICQGEERQFSENQLLGEIRLSGLRSGARGQVQIEVAFQLDASGSLDVRAVDVATGAQQTIRVNLLGGVSEDDIQAMKSRQQRQVG